MKNKFYIGIDNLYQGHLVILTELHTKNLFIQSTASWVLWNNPEEALEDLKNVDSFNKEYSYEVKNNKNKMRPSTWEEIVEAGWDKYVVNKP